jgi:hypothetical protein
MGCWQLEAQGLEEQRTPAVGVRWREWLQEDGIASCEEFDRAGHRVYRESYDRDGGIWHYLAYQFDSLGRLVLEVEGDAAMGFRADKILYLPGKIERRRCQVKVDDKPWHSDSIWLSISRPRSQDPPVRCSSAAEVLHVPAVQRLLQGPSERESLQILDAKGREQVKIGFSDGDTSTVDSFRYNRAGRLVWQCNTQSGPSNRGFELEMDYDSQGNCIRLQQRDREWGRFTISILNVNRYNGRHQLVEESITEGGEFQVVNRYAYDAKGHNIRIDHLWANSEPSYTEYGYDGRGNLARERVYAYLGNERILQSDFEVRNTYW